MTLMEMMVAMGISSALLVVIMMITVYTARSFGAISNYVALDRDSRKALDLLTSNIRQADGVLAITTNQLKLSFNAAELTYTYSPSAKTLSETWNGTTRTILVGCDTFAFSALQRNSVPGSYDYYPATLDESAAKIVQVSWVCSKQLLGNLINTESVQSAKIVIRKQ